MIDNWMDITPLGSELEIQLDINSGNKRYRQLKFGKDGSIFPGNTNWIYGEPDNVNNNVSHAKTA